MQNNYELVPNNFEREQSCVVVLVIGCSVIPCSWLELTTTSILNAPHLNMVHNTYIENKNILGRNNQPLLLESLDVIKQ